MPLTNPAPVFPVVSPFKPTGVIAESFPRGYSNLQTNNLVTSGTVLLTAIWLPACTATSLSFYAGTTGLTRGSNADSHVWFALCDSTFTTLRSTADDTSSAWAANTIHTLNLSSTVAVPAGLYYAAVMIAMGTGGSPAVPTLATTGGLANVMAQSPRLVGNFDASQTVPKSDGFTFTFASTLNNPIYAQVA